MRRLLEGKASIPEIRNALHHRCTSTRLLAFDSIHEENFSAVREDVFRCLKDPVDTVASEAILVYSRLDPHRALIAMDDVSRRMGRFAQYEYFLLLSKFPSESSLQKGRDCWNASPKTLWRRVGLLFLECRCRNSTEWVGELLEQYHRTRDDAVKSKIVYLIDAEADPALRRGAKEMLSRMRGAGNDGMFLSEVIARW